MEAKEEAMKPKTLKEIVPPQNEADFKKDMAKFYDVNPAATKEVDLKDHLASQPIKENKPRPLTSAVPGKRDTVINTTSKTFMKNAAIFHG